jgi:hypothetical protein
MQVARASRNLRYHGGVMVARSLRCKIGLREAYQKLKLYNFW